MKSNTIILIVLTIALAGGAYWYVTTQAGNDAPLTSTTVTNSASKTQFQGLVSELQSITFDTAIFSDSKFTSLVDLKVPVTAEPSGRLDPFATIQSASESMQSATTTAH